MGLESAVPPDPGVAAPDLRAPRGRRQLVAVAHSRIASPAYPRERSPSCRANAFADAPLNSGQQIDKKDALGRRVTVALAPVVIDYDRYGRMSAAGVTRVQFADRDPGNAAERSRCVTIDPGGLPRITTGPCP